ncbi:MAG TPA: hypothetical protein DDW85_00690 [Porphyromonadaceae bacterium]|nr:hypothetical protein [Porphyromonadaceae bacterium]
MKVKVLKRFCDKNDKTTIYSVGSELEFEDERAADLITRGLAESVDTAGNDPEDEVDKTVIDGSKVFSENITETVETEQKQPVKTKETGKQADTDKAEKVTDKQKTKK